MRILIIEDEAKTVNYLRKGLSEHGFTVDVATDGEDGLHLALTETYDLIVLDVMLPGRSGWEIIEELRAAGNETPVIFLSARGAVHDRVHGLELGADDYLVKPFAFSELLARIRIILRRNPLQQLQTMQIADLELEDNDFLSERISSLRSIITRHPDTASALKDHILSDPTDQQTSRPADQLPGQGAGCDRQNHSRIAGHAGYALCTFPTAGDRRQSHRTGHQAPGRRWPALPAERRMGRGPWQQSLSAGSGSPGRHRRHFPDEQVPAENGNRPADRSLCRRRAGSHHHPQGTGTAAGHGCHGRRDCRYRPASTGTKRRLAR